MREDEKTVKKILEFLLENSLGSRKNIIARDFFQTISKSEFEKVKHLIFRNIGPNLVNLSRGRGKVDNIQDGDGLRINDYGIRHLDKLEQKEIEETRDERDKKRDKIQEDLKNIQKCQKTANILLSILFIIVTLFVGLKSTNLQEEVFNLLEETSLRIDQELVIWNDEQKPIPVSTAHIATKEYHNNPIEVCIANKGLRKLNSVSISLTSPTFLRSSTEGFNEITHLESKCV